MLALISLSKVSVRKPRLLKFEAIKEAAKAFSIHPSTAVAELLR